MSLVESDVSALEAALTDDADRVLLVGAAVSAFEPTSVPDASSAVTTILDALISRVSLDFPGFPFESSERQQLAERLGGRSAVPTMEDRLVTPFEAILGLLEESCGLSASTVGALCGGRTPNEIHRALSERVSSESPVLTTNFDTAFEQVVGANTSWNPDEDASGIASSRVIKLHGTVGRADSLRHTLRSVERGYSSDVRRELLRVTNERMVVLGYAGADYDVRPLISPTGNQVFWLELPGRPVPPFVEKLAKKRDVILARGDLSRLVAGRARYAGRDVSAFREALEADVVGKMSSVEVLDVVAQVIRQAAVHSTQFHNDVARFSGYMERVCPDPEILERHLAEEDHRKGTVRSRARSARRYLRLSRQAVGVDRLTYRSDAGDRLDGWLWGQGPLARRFTYRVHARAAESSTPSAPRHSTFRFRAARSALARGDAESAVAHLEKGLSAASVTTWEQGVSLRLLAFARAASGLPYEEYIERSVELHRFGGEPESIANSLRMRAACHVLAGKPELAIRQLELSLESHTEAGQRAGELQTRVLLKLVKASPWLARRLILSV